MAQVLVPPVNPNAPKLVALPRTVNVSLRGVGRKGRLAGKVSGWGNPIDANISWSGDRAMVARHRHRINGLTGYPVAGEVIRNDGGDWNEPEMGGFLGIKIKLPKIKVKAILKAAASVARSPITKAVAGGVAAVFPPAGVPLAAGVVVADRLARNVKSSNPKKQKAAKAVVFRTAALAKAGNPDAKRMLKLIAAQSRQHKRPVPGRRPAAPPPRPGPRPRALRFTVTAQGRILPG